MSIEIKGEVITCNVDDLTLEMSSVFQKLSKEQKEYILGVAHGMEVGKEQK